MGKSAGSKKSKEKKKECQKTQIKDFKKRKVKVGKKIPKAENATLTNFKSKSILIREQLRTAGDASAHDTKSRNMKELFVKLRHYNSSMRQDAVIGLREILTKFPSEIMLNLSSLISSVTALFTDTTDSVRMSAIALTKLVLTTTTPDQVTPFFPMIEAHMCSAMTHIHEDIQIDSLKILDIILDIYPGLVVKHSQQIIPNFLNLIAKKHGQAKLGSAMTLTVNPGSKLVGKRWQHLVLRRLETFLKIILTPPPSSATSTVSESDSRAMNVNVDSKHVTRVQILKHNANPFLFTNAYRIRYDDLRPQTSVNKIEMKELISAILPVLFECWVETSPMRLLTQNLPGNAVGTDHLYGLYKILSVIKLLCYHIESSSTTDLSMSWFRKTYLKSLEKHVFPIFPCEMGAGRTKQKRSKSSSEHLGNDVELSAFSMNLTICEIISTLSTSKYLRTDWYRQAEVFVCESLEKSNFNNEQFQSLLRVVEQLMKVSKQKDVILQHVYQCYSRTHILSQNRSSVIALFSKIILAKNKDDNHGLASCPAICKWMEGLPLLLRQVNDKNSVVTDTVLAVMLNAVSSNNKHIADIFITNVTELFDIEFFSVLTQQQQRKLFELLYHVTKLGHVDGDSNLVEDLNILCNKQLIRQLVGCCLYTSTSATVAVYLTHILYDRYISSQSQAVNVDSLCNLLSILVTFLIGYQNNKLHQTEDEMILNSDELQTELISILGCSVYSVSTENWVKHEHITRAVQRLLIQFEPFQSCWLTVLDTVASVMTSVSILPVSTIWSICSTILAVHPDELDVPLILIKPLSISCLVTLCYSATSSESTYITNNIQYLPDLLEVVVLLLARYPSVTSDMLEILARKIDECQSNQSFSRLSSVTLMILQSPPLSNQLGSNKLMSAVISNIKVNDYCDLNSDTIKNLCYHSTLLNI